MTSEADIEDKYVHMEEVLGDDALDWVRGENAKTLGGRKIEESEGYKSMLSILDSKEKIPYTRKVTVGGVEYLHNFWKDDEHVRGIWRRTSYEEYKKADPEWELLLDVDELGKKEGESWVYKGSTVLDDAPGNLAILQLSRAGADSTVCREFDLAKKEFVADNPFELPDAKSNVQYLDKGASISDIR